MDEVMVEKFGLHLFNQFKGTNHTVDSFPKLFMQDELDENERERFYDFILSRKNVYDGVPLMEGVKEVLPGLNEKYLIYICSDYLFKGCEWRASKLVVDKCEMLKQNFPYIHPKQYVFMHAKDLLTADIMIDDRPSNFSPKVKQCLLFTRNHNKHLTSEEIKDKNITRVNSWKEISEILL